MSGTNYPASLDDSTTLPQPGPNTVTNAGSVTHAALHDNEIGAITALETKLGTGSSTSTTSTVLRASSNGTSTWGKVVLTSDVTGTLPVANGGSGVTTSTGTGNIVLSNSPALVTPTGIVKGDVGLGNVDNTSDATKNNASVTLTNKTISGSNNTLSSISGSSLVDASVTSSKLNTSASGINTSANATTTSATYVTTLSDSVTTSVTVTIGNNGIVLLNVSAYFFNTGTNIGFITYSASGANTIAASDSNAIQHKMNSNDGTVGSSFLVTGLSAGSTTFTLNYRTTGGTETFGVRRLSAIPL